MANHLFISYKHQAASAKVALRMHEYLTAVSAGMNFSLFMDTDIDAAELWSDVIEKELEKTTHFVCLRSMRGTVRKAKSKPGKPFQVGSKWFWNDINF